MGPERIVVMSTENTVAGLAQDVENLDTHVSQLQDDVNELDGRVETLEESGVPAAGGNGQPQDVVVAVVFMGNHEGDVAVKAGTAVGEVLRQVRPDLTAGTVKIGDRAGCSLDTPIRENTTVEPAQTSGKVG